MWNNVVKEKPHTARHRFMTTLMFAAVYYMLCFSRTCRLGDFFGHFLDTSSQSAASAGCTLSPGENRCQQGGGVCHNQIKITGLASLQRKNWKALKQETAIAHWCFNRQSPSEQVDKQKKEVVSADMQTEPQPQVQPRQWVWTQLCQLCVNKATIS